MRKKVKIIFILLTSLIALGIILSSLISNSYIEDNQKDVIEEYKKTVQSIPYETLEKEREKAKNYNKLLVENTIVTGPFNPVAEEFEEDYGYNNILNIGKDSVIGYINIPKISVNLPIYHGSSEEVLKKGIGHLQNTSFPIGGEGSHAVLLGHTGLPTAKLFTDLDKLEEGNVFYVEVLEEKLAYEIDQIKVVVPEDTSDLTIDPNKDYITLVTCTPYGENTHRLLVRGKRIPYTEEVEKKIKEEQSEKTESTWINELLKVVNTGLKILEIILIIVALVLFFKKKVRSRK